MSEMALELIHRAKAEGWDWLDLGNCGIVGELPLEIAELGVLKELYLGSEWYVWQEDGWIHEFSENKGEPNKIGQLPERLPPNIEVLATRGNPIADHSCLSTLVRLRSLDISETLVDNIQFIETLFQLEGISVSATPLKEISPVARLTQLKALSIDVTQVEDISPLRELAELRDLWLAHTRISDLSPLEGLPKLRKLYVQNTKVSMISPIQKLKEIRRLDISNTTVSDLSEIKDLIQLGVPIRESLWRVDDGINIKNCPLTNPPIEIALEGNEAILRYWTDLEKGRKLERYVNRDVQLILIGNSNAGKSTLAKYLTTGELSDEHPSTHGMETVIWEPDFEIERLKDEEVNPKGWCRVRILDFGGQEYYHDAHHLFFNDNTAFVLLWDRWGNKIADVQTEILFPGNDTTEKVWQQNYPLQYWLDAIEYHCETKLSRFIWEYSSSRAVGAIGWVGRHGRRRGGRYVSVRGHWRNRPTWGISNNSTEDVLAKYFGSGDEAPLFAPTIVVQNKIDRDEIAFISQDKLKEKFEFIYDFAAISLETDHPRRLKQFEMLIEELLGEMRIVGSELPVQYGWVKDAVEVFEGNEYEMAITDFELWANCEISKRNSAPSIQLDRESMELLINYLKRIGLVLYYPGKADLKDRVFLRPDKVLRGIYEILRGVRERSGRFDDQHARDAQVDGNPETLLLLMRQFKIIFLEGGQAGKYVAPLYLNPKPIQGVQLFLDLFQKPVYRIQYEAFIHKSVVLHFFEVFGPRAYREETLGGQELYYYWRNGIVIKDERSDSRVLVQFFIGEEDDRRQEGFVPAHIDIFLLGAAESSGFLKEVLETMETINKGWNTTVMVTHNGDDFVPLEVVEKAVEEKQFTFFHEERIFQLMDFRKFIALKMPMKKVFISYAKTDVEFLQQLESHLAVFKRNGHIATWTDRKLSPGEAWDGKIKKELEEADIILFLVSADFLSTDYVWDIEMKTAIERDARREAKVVPIVVRPCVWKDTPLWKFYSPEKATPISMAENRDAAWERVVMGLERIMVTGAEGGGL